jgi:hypothetical protein
MELEKFLKQQDNMSKKLYKHLIETNYENISERIKKAQKKSPARKLHGKQN